MAEEKKENKKSEKPAAKVKSEKGAAAKKQENAKKASAIPLSPKIGQAKALDILQFVLMTEKAVQLIESQNKLVFVVHRRSNKSEIKQAAESMFNSRVNKVTTVIDQSGRKKAFIKFSKEGEAGEIAIRLGII